MERNTTNDTGTSDRLLIQLKTVFGNKSFSITDPDKEWVHEVFQWLIKTYGYPDAGFSPVLFTEDFFPNTLTARQTEIEPLLFDLCHLFDIQHSLISFEIEEDFLDSHGMPYEIQGKVFECDLDIVEIDGKYHYKLFFAKHLLNNPKRVVFNAVLKFIQINLSKGDLAWITKQEDDFLFYLVGIYTGWGVILSQTMIDVGKDSSMFWETSWKYISPMPVPIMAYSLALHANMIELKDPAWKTFLPADIKKQFEKAALFIDTHGNPFYSKQEMQAGIIAKEGDRYWEKKDFESAVEAYRKVLFLTQDNYLKSSIYNNIGYYHLHKSEYQQSIPHFQKAVELDPGFAHAYDNMGFAFIMSGDTQTGRHYIMLAQESSNNEASYSYRNLALYYQNKGDIEKAKEYFKKAFENISMPVDWLEYFYARFLYEQGEKNEALKYLQMAVEKKERKAIDWMNEIQNTI